MELISRDSRWSHHPGLQIGNSVNSKVTSSWHIDCQIMEGHYLDGFNNTLWPVSEQETYWAALCSFSRAPSTCCIWKHSHVTIRSEGKWVDNKLIRQLVCQTITGVVSWRVQGSRKWAAGYLVLSKVGQICWPLLLLWGWRNRTAP